MDCATTNVEKLLGEEGGGHETQQLIFMWPVPSQGGLLGDDGCDGDVGRKE